MAGRVESWPDDGAGVVSVDAPVAGEGTDDVESVEARGVACRWSRGAATVLDLDPGVVAWADSRPDGEDATGHAGAAVNGGIRGEFGGTEDHVVCHGAVGEEPAQVGPGPPDLPGGAGIGDAGEGRCEHS